MAGYKGARPATPSLRVPLKWAKSPRSSGVRSLSLGAEMGSKGGIAGRAGTGAGGQRKGNQIRYLSVGGCFIWVPDSLELQTGAGGFGGI